MSACVTDWTTARQQQQQQLLLLHQDKKKKRDTDITIIDCILDTYEYVHMYKK